MLKALLKKQFMELFRGYFVSRKNGKARSKGQTVGLFILFAALIAYGGAMVFGLAFGLGSQLMPLGMKWLYFTLMGSLAIMLGVFGSVFNTYTSLYRAKDNDLLISMPIPPSRIVLVRLSSVYGLGFLFTGVIWVPTLLYDWIFELPGAAEVIFGLLLWPFIAAFVSVLTCALGWVVALVSGKVSNKSFVTVALSVVLLGLYYVFCFRLTEILGALVENSEAIGGFMKVWFNYLYQMGQAAAGNGIGMLIFAGVTAGLSALCLWLMARTFIGLATRTADAPRAAHKAGAVKSHSVRAALLRREFKRFGASATYMLNCGLGLAFMAAIAVLALVKQDTLQTALAPYEANMPWVTAALPVLAAAVPCAMAALNAITAPSVSLEGKHIWILQSLPVQPAEVLNAKLWMHVLVNAEVTMATAGVLCFCLRADLLASAAAVLYAGVYVWLTGALGLMIGVRHANLQWTTEAQPVKQSLSAFLAVLLGFGIAVAAPLLYFLLQMFVPLNPALFLALMAALEAALAALTDRWLTRTGARLFAQL